MSGVSMVLIMAAIIVPILAAAGWDMDNLNIGSKNDAVPYLFTFLFYLVNYFVVVFFIWH
ncbi:MAG: hypothetical protein WDM90_17335 [Ferruginibacter sp.]